ncbi:MAG: HEAT repeat domain-containing protein, partial [Planctomycetota bacterium]|nr:HEAT repeat domain-containing protein [Planctomycetota bacterium]
IVFPLKLSSHQGQFDVSLFIVTSKALSQDHLFWETTQFGVQAFPKPRSFTLTRIERRRRKLHQLLTSLVPKEAIPDQWYMTKLVGRGINGPKNKVEDWEQDFSIRFPSKKNHFSNLDRLKISLKGLRRSEAGKGETVHRDILKRMYGVNLTCDDSESLKYLFQELAKANEKGAFHYDQIDLGALINGCRGWSFKELRPFAKLIGKEVSRGGQRKWKNGLNVFLRNQGEAADQLCLEMLQSKNLGWQQFSINYIKLNQLRAGDQGKLSPVCSQFLCLALKNKDATNRFNAVLAIPDGPIDAKLASALKLMLKDPDLRVRKEAEAVLSRKDPVTDLWDSVVEDFESDSKAQRYAAIRLMGTLPRDSVKAVPFLLKALDDEDLKNRRRAARTLGFFRNGAKETIPALLKRLKDPAQKDMHGSVISGLSCFGPKAKLAYPFIKARMNDENLRVRSAARECLMYMGKDAADHLSQLMILYKNGGADIKRRIAGVLAVCGAKAVPHFINLLNSSDLEDRALAAFGISRAGLSNKDYVPGLLKLAKEKAVSKALGEQDVRGFAFNALGWMKKDALGAVPLLKKYADWSDSNSALSVHASFALWRINGSKDKFFEVTTEVLSWERLECIDDLAIRQQRRDLARVSLRYLKVMGERAREKELDLLFLLKVDSLFWCHKILIETLQKVSGGREETITHLQSLLRKSKHRRLARRALAEIRMRKLKKLR